VVKYFILICFLKLEPAFTGVFMFLNQKSQNKVGAIQMKPEIYFSSMVGFIFSKKRSRFCLEVLTASILGDYFHN
jgi:hypothetical protein